MSCIKVNAMSYALLIKALTHGDLTMRELADETGLHYVTVRDYCRELYKVRMIHIARWEQDARHRYSVKVYKLGTARDAKQPTLTGAQRQARRREKLRALANPLLRMAA